MFLQSGNFYSTLRLLKDDASYLKRLSRLGVIESPAASLPSPDANLGRKRPRQYEAPVLRLQAPRSTSLPSASASASSSALLVYEPPVPVLGSFSWAIKEDAEVIKVLGFKYAKLPILEKLGLAESQICLASYLSRKGAAACPCSTLAGHDAMDSALHVFSDAARALRPSFEEPPYRIRGSGAPVLPASTPTPRGRGGHRQHGRSGRQARGGMSAQR